MSVRRPKSLSRVAGRERVRQTCGEMMTWFVLLRLVPLKLVVLSLQPAEVGLFSGTGCMVPQPFFAGGNQPYLKVLGHNR
jgi:hypothetical protein